MGQGLLDKLIGGVEPYLAEMIDDGASRFDHASAPGAQYHPQCTDQRQPNRLGAASCFKVIENGSTLWAGRSEGDDLRLSRTEIPDRELRLLMLDLFDELLQGHLASRDLAPKEFLEELGAAQAGDVGSPLLGDEALRVPLDAGGCPHLSCELFRGQVE